MPNSYNFAFDYKLFLYTFMIIAIWGFINNYKYMFSQRRRKYSPKKQMKKE